QFLKDVCIDLGLDQSRIQVVHNTIHPRFLEGTKAIPWNGKDQLKIITIGRLVEMKGHEYAIKAMALLKKSYPHFQYMIGGSGVLEEKLKALTTQLDLDENVTFLGNIPHQDVPKVLADSHICLIPGIRADDGEEDTF